jgi:hypothetical protein
MYATDPQTGQKCRRASSELRQASVRPKNSTSPRAKTA